MWEYMANAQVIEVRTYNIDNVGCARNGNIRRGLQSLDKIIRKQFDGRVTPGQRGQARAVDPLVKELRQIQLGHIARDLYKLKLVLNGIVVIR